MAPMSSNKRRNPDVLVSSKERNEYIPNFIAKKPFYVADDSTESDYLEHQRLQKSSSQDSQKWYDRGKKIGPAATKFRKGACENCGALTHKTKECLSRPRKHGAKWTGKDIQADDMVQDLSLGWDAKRDRWNGYDAKEYSAVVDEYHILEDLKRRAKNEGPKRYQAGFPSDHDDEEEEEEKEEMRDNEGVRYEEETDMGRQQSTSTRNLRIREDTAKYLVNLDLDSAKYDPKTRSMVDSGATADQTAALVAEEGFMRSSGDAAEFERAQRYAWEMQERGGKKNIHLQANPTSGEFFRKKDSEEKTKTKSRQIKALLKRYGGKEHLQDKLPEDLVVESEQYVEYDSRGAIKGACETPHKSSYPEDILINNHKSVWGSWWRDSQWGYSCCHSTVKHSYCTGEDGKRALDEAHQLPTQTILDDGVNKEINWRKEEQKAKHTIYDTCDNTPSSTLVKSRKRELDTARDEFSEAEMDIHRMKRIAANDPMRDMLGQDELVN